MGQPGHAPRPQLTPAPGTRFEQLLEQREAAIVAADEANARLKAINDGIKQIAVSEAMIIKPEEVPEGVTITGSATRPALVVFWKRQRRVNTAALRADGLYDKYAEWKGHWELRAAEGTR